MKVDREVGRWRGSRDEVIRYREEDGSGQSVMRGEERRDERREEWGRRGGMMVWVCLLGGYI